MTSWYSVSAWRGFGENVAASVGKGDPVIVTGRLVLREWTNATGEPQSSFEIEADAIGHDLTRSRTSIMRKPVTPTVAFASHAPDPIDEESAHREQAIADWSGLGPDTEQVGVAA